MTRLLRVLLVSLVGLALGVVPLAISSVAPAGAATTSQTPVMGPNLLTAAQLTSWYNSVGHAAPNLPTLPGGVQQLAQVFIDQGRAQGVRGDIAFAQSMLETGWLSFPSYGQIRGSFNNFAGLYAYNGRRVGTTCADEKKFEPTLPSRCFATPAAGVAAQITLLRSYADPTARGMGLSPSAPSDRQGVAPIWEDFGGHSGEAIWATAPYYGLRVLQLYSQALVHNGARAACLPYSPNLPGQVSGSGYWVVTANGSVYSFGNAAYHGGMAGRHLNAPITGSEATVSGNGYWQLGRDGGIFSFGDAAFHGSTGAMHLNSPVLDMTATADGHGFWMVAGDGGIFTFGDASFHGSTGAMHLNSPAMSMTAAHSGGGYWIVARDGGIFTFGVPFVGSVPNLGIHGVDGVRIRAMPSGQGYLVLSGTGGVYGFGSARFFGSVSASPLAPAVDLMTLA
jgi:hypothetical protein